ncbi:MAG TPA: gliding motility-associated C-terminal domain-containing protein [Hymenobacter sp.]|uniref:T9SS type B sorting domain-containing protein n=1 Tax=Hymenobacter sp. TaxID=1898978 RepID=UPI002D7E70C7|nr:gliding motility-associated C-terminal domain-containing protein [Hymenobacter sp.]HET9504330.1 gliding motility-associated C-terminal domain-containing protein [Hymenobacter sp.]
MVTPLLTRLGALPGLCLLWLLLALAPAAHATHLLGGEMTYRYLDANGPTAAPLRYEITVVVYNNCNAGAAMPAASAIIGIYQTSGAQLSLTATNYVGLLNGGRMVVQNPVTSPCTTVPVPPGCTNSGAAQQPFVLQKFTATVNLPRSATGYNAYWTSSARNGSINNLANPGGTALTLYTTLAPEVYANRSPVFASEAVAVLCANDTTTLLNNAVDPDGDRLVYSFGQPYGQGGYPTSFVPTPLFAAYPNGSFSATTPLGAAPNSAKLNAGTGIAKFYGTIIGNQYVVAVDVKEYRTINGVDVLIGTTRRDLQLVVGQCPPTTPPVLPTAAGSSTAIPRNYTVEAGSSLSIPITTTQADGHPLEMTATSVLLDGTGGYNATFAGNAGSPTYTGSPLGSATASGASGSVSGTFVYSPGCADARATPYDITLTIVDKGCAGKTTADVLHITVTKPSGPTAIAGDGAICGLGSTRSYTASGGTAPGVSWRLSGGGAIVGSRTANPVTVNWTTAGTYTLTARGLSQYGCLTDSVTKTVVVAPAAVLTVTGNQSICQGGSTSISVAGAAPYTVSDGTTTVSGAGPFTLAPGQTTTYTITGTATGTGCTPTAQFTITVNPQPVATTGPAVSTCSGVPVALGTAPVAGFTYSWSPATGLSNAAIANPTATLTNTSGAATTQTYTLRVTGAGGCTATSTVAVTVSPAPTITPGAAVAFCAGGTGQLGAAPLAGYTYSWSPTTGLSSSTVANPTVTLPNATSAPITQTYTLAVTGPGGCPATATVDVTVNPMPTAVPGAALALCSGTAGQLGAAPVAGHTYRWSPSTGLSSATDANPTITLTNTTGAPITQTYTLTVTNATGCVSTGTVAVTVNPLPTAVPGAAVAFCSGNTSQLGSASVAGLTYSWSPSTGLSSATSANPSITLTNTTGAPITQTYTLTTTNAGTGCATTGTVLVTVNPAAVAGAGANVSFCAGGSGQLGAAAVSGYTYSWSPATGLSNATSANPTVTLANTTGAPLTQTYTLTATNATGCVNTATVDVTVNPIPVAVAGAAVTLCSGSAATLGAAPAAGLTYSWSPATGLSSSTVANPTVTPINTTTATTTQVYTLTVTGAGNCRSTATVAVTVVPLPVANAGAAVTICSGSTAQMGSAPASGLTYSWAPATGLSNAASANPTVTLTNVNAAGTAIAPTYTLTVTNPATGCMSTSTVVVTVNAEIVPGTIGPNQTVCASSTPVPLTSTPGPSGGYGTYTYQWESSADNLTWTTVPGATSATYAPGPLAATSYYRRRVSSGSCAEQVSNSVKLELQPQLITGVTLATPATQCAGTSLTFTPVPTNAGSAPTFRWYVNNALVASSPTYTSSTLNSGDVVRVEVVPTAGFCATSLAVASVTIDLTPVTLPTVRIKSQTTLPACSSTPVVLAADSIGSPGAGMAYQWQVDGVSVSGATSPTFSPSTLRDGQVVTLVVTTPSACGPLTSTSNPLAVSIIQNVELSAGPDKTIMEGDIIELEGTANGNYPVLWSPLPTLTFPAKDPLHPMAAPTVTTTYTLSGKAGYCTGESQVTITVTPRVRIPNAFSPNGDGLDDAWEIDRIAEYPGSRVIVFNRWGMKLFETTGYNRSNQWNGTVNGQPAPIGTYYYLITLGNGKSYTGPLTIVY